ncbi:MAG TPA: hypothetical protein VJU61_26780 [Polyangiaceae bacterium]|nr:hypothetical protein [Polyangiaceae bacterium]
MTTPDLLHECGADELPANITAWRRRMIKSQRMLASMCCELAHERERRREARQQEAEDAQLVRESERSPCPSGGKLVRKRHPSATVPQRDS